MRALEKLAEPDWRGSRLAISVFAITAVQAIASLAIFSVPTLAPSISAALNLESAFVGWYMSLLYVAGLATALIGNRLASSLGPGRTSQLVLACCILGMGVAALDSYLALMAAAIILGAGYGLVHPPGSVLLQRIAPPAHRNLLFSIRQTGVPLGGLGASLMLPTLADAFGWQIALASVAAPALLLMLAIQPLNGSWRQAGELATPIGTTMTSSSSLVRNSRFWRLAGITLFLGTMQLSVMTYVVTMLVVEFEQGLVFAGTVAASVYAAGVLARIFWSLVADWTGSARAVLLVITAITMASSLALGVIPLHTPVVALVSLLFVLGATSSGWNGVLMAEAVRGCSAREAAQVTGGVAAALFVGAIIGLPLFAAVYGMLGSYATTFAVFGAALALPLFLQFRILLESRE